MISQFFLIVVKILVILLILVGMVLILVGLQHYLLKPDRKDMDDSENADFRSQIDRDSRVISPYNLFHRFLSDNESTPTVPRFFGGNGRERRENRQHEYRRRF